MLTQPLSVFATSTNAAAVAQAGGPLSGGAAAPTPLMNYTAPVTNSPLTTDLPPEHHGDGDAPHGHVRQDADVHAQHDRAVEQFTVRAALAARTTAL